MSNMFKELIAEYYSDLNEQKGAEATEVRFTAYADAQTLATLDSLADLFEKPRSTVVSRILYDSVERMFHSLNAADKVRVAKSSRQKEEEIYSKNDPSISIEGQTKFEYFAQVAMQKLEEENKDA